MSTEAISKVESNGNTAPKRVIVIDSQMSGIATISALFKKNNQFQAFKASKQSEAVQFLQETPPDLIVIDIEHMEVDAPLLFNMMKEIPHLKVIAFTSKDSKEHAMALGADAFFEKEENLFQLGSSYGVGKKILSAAKNLLNLQEKIKVMVVDDAALMRLVITNLLSTATHIEVVGQSTNGQEALDRLKSIEPDVILLDLEMPVMDGLTFLRHVRLKSRAKVIVLSSVALGGSTQSAEARRLGADAILTKPSGAVSLDLAEKSGHLILKTIEDVVNNP